MKIQVFYLNLDINNEDKLKYKEVYRVGQRYIKKEDIKDTDELVGVKTEKQLLKIVNKEGPLRYKEKNIKDIKSKAKELIEKDYPIWKQNNLQGKALQILCDEQEQLKKDSNFQISQESKEILKELNLLKGNVDKIRKRSDELESSLNDMTFKQLRGFNAFGKKLWENL